MRATRALLITAGAAMIGYAVFGVLTSADIKLSRQLPFLVAALLAHDAILAPLFIGIGAIVTRVVRPASRGVVQGALIVTAAVTFVAVPFLIGDGRTPDVPSALPRDYLGGYAITLGAIWLVATLMIVRRGLAAAHAQRQPRPRPTANTPSRKQ